MIFAVQVVDNQTNTAMSTPLFSHKVAEIFVKTDDFCIHFEKEFKNYSLPVSKDAKKRK